MILRLQNLVVLAATIVLPLVSTEAVFDADTPIASLLASAKAARIQGQNNDALSYFDAALVRNPSDYLTLFQRGATYLAMGRNNQAKSDFDSALKIRPDFEGALMQRAKIHARNAEWALAKEDYQKVGKKGEAELASLEESEGASYLAFEAEKKGDWETCVNQAGVAIMTAGTSLSLRQLRAKCRLERGEVQEGVSDLIHVLQISPGSIEPHLQISSMLFYSLGDSEKALAQIKKCLHSDPESKPCKKLFREEKQINKSLEKVQNFMDSKQFASAAKLLAGAGPETEDPGLIRDVKAKTEAGIQESHIHEKAARGLYISLVEKACEAYYSVKSKKAAQYCTEASNLNADSLYALLHKAQTQVDEENYEAAIHTLNKAQEHHGQQHGQINQKLQEAQALLKRSKSKDYYKILGVSRDADDRTIKRAYRQATKQYHPDKAMARGVTKEDAEKKMAGINEAYEVLSDPQLKARFDQGDDPNDPQNQGNPFQQGGNPFGFGGQQFVFQQGGGFPGGGGKRHFSFQHGGGGGGGFPGGFPFGM